MWRTALLGLVAMAVLLIACGGGSTGSVKYATVQYGNVKYAATVVPIKHLDLSGEALSAASIFQPAFADRYPPVVAEVNGKPITGKQLASELVLLELGRRNLLNTTPDAFPPGYVNSQLQEAKSADPLKLIIDEEMERQAVERLGLLPTHDEAVAYTKQQEDMFLHPQGTVSPENRAQTLEILRLQGFPDSNWASDDRIVENYREQLGLAKLVHQICPKYGTPTPTPTPTGFMFISGGESCVAFLAKERKNADIVYYVRWAD